MCSYEHLLLIIPISIMDDFAQQSVQRTRYNIQLLYDQILINKLQHPQLTTFEKDILIKCRNYISDLSLVKSYTTYLQLLAYYDS